MKLNDKQINELHVVGENNTKQAQINQNKIAKLQHLLTTGLYKDGIGSTIVEITNNALDSIIQSGKDPMKNPVYVYIEENPNNNDRYQLRIVDNGLGLDENEFENILMNYLTSTKEENDDLIGCFGIGAKSWCSISNTATFICRKNGVERNFLCYKDAVFVKFDKVYEKPTTEENGVTFILPLDSYQKYTFISKAVQKLAYYDNVVLFIDNEARDNTIYRNDLFQWATMNNNKRLHFSLKDVYYTIDWDQLGISPIDVPICLRFSLTDGIMPTPSREDIQYTNSTKELFKKRITEVAHWFKAKYESTATDVYPSIIAGWTVIGKKEKIITLQDLHFDINPLLDFAKLEVKEVSVEGITLQNPIFYKKHFDELNYEYDVVAELTYNGWKRGHGISSSVNHYHVISQQVVVLTSTPTGYFKKFLASKYSSGTIFVVCRKSRKLFKPRSNSYHFVLGLSDIVKEKWRGYINEWKYVQKTVSDTFKDATKLEQSTEFKEYVERKKEQAKERAKLLGRNYGGFYIPLNKQKGQITIGKSRISAKGGIFAGKAMFNKTTIDINTLHKLGNLTVYFTKDEAEIDSTKSFIYKAMQALPKVRFVWINPREIKFVKDLKTWKTKEQFMFSKPLKRYITANLISDYISNETKNEKLILQAFPEYFTLKNQLKEYVKKNSKDASNELWYELRQIASNNQLYDMEIYSDFLKFKKMIEDCGFVNYLKEVNSLYTTDAEKKVINNMIYIMLKQKRIDSEFLHKFELIEVKKDEPIPDTEIKYWMPNSTYGRVIGHMDDEIDENMVWLKKSNLLNIYPKCEPIAIRESDVINPDIQDDWDDEDEDEDDVVDDGSEDDAFFDDNDNDNDEDDDNDDDEPTNPYDEDEPESFKEDTVEDEEEEDSFSLGSVLNSGVNVDVVEFEDNSTVSIPPDESVPDDEPPTIEELAYQQYDPQ